MSAVAKVVKVKAQAALVENIAENLAVYLEGDIGSLIEDKDELEMRGVTVDENLLKELNPEASGAADAKNAKIVYEALNGLTPYGARDSRFWVWLCHSLCGPYCLERWISNKPLKEEDQLKGIKSHFFCTDGRRSYTRANALAALWWWAYYCDSYQGLSLDKTLDVFLRLTDIRSSTIERPTIMSSRKLLHALLDVLIERHDKEAFDHPIFERAKYRAWMRLINRTGGTRLLAALPQAELKRIFDEQAASVGAA